MPRPIKKKRIAQLPKFVAYGPLKGQSRGNAVITMTIDEYECIRLMDYEDLTQEQAAQSMNVARTSVQRIYVSARKKIAQSLVEGAKIVIEGGHFTLCQGQHKRCRNCGDHDTAARPRQRDDKKSDS